MAQVTHQKQGSRGTIPSRTQLWTKGMKLRNFATTVHMVGRIDRCMLSKRSLCLSIGASHALGPKRKNLKVLAFKGSPHNNEARSIGSGSKIPNKPVEISYAPQMSEELREESPKLQHAPLSCASGGDEAIGRSQAIHNLFKKWLTMLHTPSPEQAADEVLEEGSIPRELSRAEDGDPAQ